jgi:hypothetical protein
MNVLLKVISLLLLKTKKNLDIFCLIFKNIKHERNVLELITVQLFSRLILFDSIKGGLSCSGIVLLFFYQGNFQMVNSEQSIKPWEFLSKAIPNSSVSDFEFGMPMNLVKSGDKSGRRYIKGVASTPDKDLQSEYVIQKGMDLRYFKQHGYFNNDHKPGFENKVGQPTKAEIKKIKDINGKSVLGLWVEGYLWPKGQHQIADSIWELAKALAAADSNRKLGFSIQGKVLEREGQKILKAWIQDIAITPSPVNSKTWLDVVDDFSKSWATEEDYDYVSKSIASYDSVDILKSMYGDFSEKALSVGGGSILVPESLEGTRNATFRGAKYEKDKNLDSKDDEVEKSLIYSYNEFLNRGYSDKVSEKAAIATVARSLLSF